MLTARAGLVVTLALAAGACSSGTSRNTSHAPSSTAAATSSSAAALLAPGTVTALDGAPVAATSTGLVLVKNDSFDEYLLADGRGLASTDLRRTTGLTQMRFATGTEPGGPTVVEGSRAGGGLAGDSRIAGRLDDDGTLAWEHELGRADATSATVEGVTQGVVIVRTSNGGFDGLDVNDGRQLWTVGPASVGRNAAVHGLGTGVAIIQGAVSGVDTFTTLDATTGAVTSTSTTDPQPLDDRSDSTPDLETKYFLDGDTLVEDHRDGAQATLSRRGAHAWSLGNGRTARAFAVGFDQTRIVAEGPSGDLVLLDAVTGKQIGAAIPHTQLSAFATCGTDHRRLVFLTDDEIAVGCSTTGSLVRFAA